MRIYRVRIRVAKYYDAVFDFGNSVEAVEYMAMLAKRMNQDNEIEACSVQIFLEVVEPEPQEAEDESDQ